jgi:hypothetical protein
VEREATMAVKAVSIAELKRELAKREKALERLEARREKLATELRKVEADIAQLKGESEEGLEPAAAGQRETGTLRQAVAAVLAGTHEALGPKDIAGRLPDVGYVSRSKSLPVMVGQLLSGLSEFHRVARGKYRLSRSHRPGAAARKRKKTAAAVGKKSES